MYWVTSKNRMPALADAVSITPTLQKSAEKDRVDVQPAGARQQAGQHREAENRATPQAQRVHVDHMWVLLSKSVLTAHLLELIPLKLARTTVRNNGGIFKTNAVSTLAQLSKILFCLARQKIIRNVFKKILTF